MEKNMKRIIDEIIKINSDILGANPVVRKINVGFTNTIYNIDDKYIIKICTNSENEKSFQNEINFYLNNKENPNIPILFKYSEDKSEVPYLYEIMEKLDGVSLYNIWHKFSEQEREEIIQKICNILKSFHSHLGEPYDWSKYIKHHVEKYLTKIKETDLLSSSEILLIEQAMEYFDDFLKTDKFAFIHNDLHFDNIFYKDGKIKIIDFERSMIAPIDKELDIFLRMVEMPWKYASEETEHLTQKKDYENIKSYLQKYYPEILTIPNLDARLAIYDLREYLRNYYFFQEEVDIKEKIINSAKLIIEKKENCD